MVSHQTINPSTNPAEAPGIQVFLVAPIPGRYFLPPGYCGSSGALQLTEGAFSNALGIMENKLATQRACQVPEALCGDLPHPLARNKSLVSNYTKIILNSRQVKTKSK